MVWKFAFANPKISAEETPVVKLKLSITIGLGASNRTFVWLAPWMMLNPVSCNPVRSMMFSLAPPSMERLIGTAFERYRSQLLTTSPVGIPVNFKGICLIDLEEVLTMGELWLPLFNVISDRPIDEVICSRRKG